MVYRFGEFVLDEVAHTLRRGGEEIAVEPKVLAFIILLVQHRGRALPRALLHRTLWKEVSVGESSLNRIAKEARYALGDNGAGQNVIRTLRNVGYRFETAVTLGDAATPSDESLRLLAKAEQGLIAALESSSVDLRAQIEDFARTCYEALDRAKAVSFLRSHSSTASNVIRTSAAD